MTDWEQRYRDGDTPWEKGTAAPPLEELIGRVGRGIFGSGPVWVPGCGHGHDVRALAGHGLEVVGVDLAASAVGQARTYPAVGGERYELADFLDRDWVASAAASAIWEHTCFCAIDPGRRDDYAAAAATLLQPGNHLCGVFFLTPHDPGEAEVGPPFGSTVDEIDACLGPWFERVDSWVPVTGYPGRVGREWIAIYRRLANRPVAGRGRCR